MLEAARDMCKFLDAAFSEERFALLSVVLAQLAADWRKGTLDSSRSSAGEACVVIVVSAGKGGVALGLNHIFDLELSLGCKHVDRLQIAALIQDIAHDREAKSNQRQVALAGEVMGLNHAEGVHAEVLQLDLGELANMVLELAVFELLQVLGAKNHVLDELRDLLVELRDVLLLADEVLDFTPRQEHRV